MKIIVHKGTTEIGGSCIEISTETTRIILDYGEPLKEGSKLVSLEGINIDALIVSHPHQDHYGLIDLLDKTTPVYSGEFALELMQTTRLFTGRTLLTNNFQTYQSDKSFMVGDITITPYLNDHSAADSYTFLIDAEGKKVIYSGDFRANGRKSKLFHKLIKNQDLKDADVLLMEGTMLQRDNSDFPTEESVEEGICKTISNDSISFIIASSQNIDRVVSAYKAAKKAKKILVIDIYTAWILEKARAISSSIPNIFWKEVKVLSRGQYASFYYAKIKDNKDYFGDFAQSLYKHDTEIDLKTIAQEPGKYFLKISPSYILRMMEELALKSTPNVIYSQWLGYLTKEFSKEKQVKQFDEIKENSNFIYAHTSGHANLDDLKTFVKELKPKKVIPIHTEYPEKFEEHFDNVQQVGDGEEIKVL